MKARTAVYVFQTALFAPLLAVSTVEAGTIYFEDFEGTVGSEWSSTVTDVTPVGARRFLGQFCNQTVSVSFSGVPTNTPVTLELDLYIILTWDGTGEFTGSGPDVFRMEMAGGPTLLNTTFANWPSQVQNYPDPFPGSATHPPGTGAAEQDTLGYTWSSPDDKQDAVYHLTFTFPHPTSTLGFNFTASGLQRIQDESWGIDNVRLSIPDVPVPEPATTLFLGSAILGALFLRRNQNST